MFSDVELHISYFKGGVVVESLGKDGLSGLNLQKCILYPKLLILLEPSDKYKRNLGYLYIIPFVPRIF